MINILYWNLKLLSNPQVPCPGIFTGIFGDLLEISNTAEITFFVPVYLPAKVPGHGTGGKVTML